MRLRDLVPWRDFVIETSWSPEVSIVELAKRVDAPRLPFFGIDHPERPFQGKSVSPTALEFRRTVDWKVESAIPATIRASVTPALGSGACVRVRIRPRAAGGVALALVGLFAVASFVLAVFALIAGEVRGALVALGGSVVVVASALLRFALESDRSERILRGIFERAPALPPPDPPYESGEPYR
jgi:hypothetical protein